MGLGYLNVAGTFKQLLKWYVKSPPSAPVLEFDGSNEPKDFDTAFKTHIQNNGNIETFDFTNPPQGNSILMPSFTLGNKFKLEFRIYGKVTTNNAFACIFSSQHDRQGVFSDSVFAMYPPASSEGYPTDVCAMHFVPIGDSTHKQLRLSRDRIKIVYHTSSATTEIQLVFAGIHNNKPYYENNFSALTGFTAGKWRLFYNGTMWQLSSFTTSSTSPSDSALNTLGMFPTRSGSFEHLPTIKESDAGFDTTTSEQMFFPDGLNTTLTDYYMYYVSTDAFEEVAQQTVFGGRRLNFRGLFDNAWHNVIVNYDNGSISVQIDNDDGNFVTKSLFRNKSNLLAGTNPQTSVPHGSGYGASFSGRLMSSYQYFASYINSNGFNSNSNSTPRFNAHSGKLDNFKLTTYPSDVETTTINYRIKDGVSAGSYQPIKDFSGNNNYGQHIYASDVNLYDLWDYTAGSTDNWREVKEAWYNEDGVWKKFWQNKITLHITSTVADYDLFVQAGSPSVAVEVDLYIDSGAIVYSTTTSHGAIYGSSNFPSGSTIRIFNNGTIWGKGGDGGDCPYATGLLEAREVDRDQNEIGGVLKTLNAGGSASDVEAGEDGGDGITLAGDTTVDNTFGRIFGGGGGGGATRIFNYSYDNAVYTDTYNYWLDASCAGGGGAGYIGGTGGALVKKVSSWDWSKPASSINQSGTIWGSGDTTTIKANDGGRYTGAKALVGCHNLEYIYESDYYGKGGSLGEAGENHNLGKRKSRGRGAVLKIVANNGGRGYCINKNNHTLTFIGNQNDFNRFRGGILDPSNPPADDDGAGTEHNIASDSNPTIRDIIDSGCCVLSTACFHQDLISGNELMSIIKWRIRNQSKEFLADVKWLGYQVGFKSLSNLMRRNKKVANLVYKYIVKDWIKKSQGKGVYPIRTFLISSYCVLVFLFRYKECIELSKTISKNPKETLKSYKKLIQSK